MTVPIKFGTDGWRGVIADDFTFDNVRRVAGAIAVRSSVAPSLVAAIESLLDKQQAILQRRIYPRESMHWGVLPFRMQSVALGRPREADIQAAWSEPEALRPRRRVGVSACF